MRHYFDTQFVEGQHRPLFGKKRHFIDIISIGIVSADGKEYSAISKEYNYNDADGWVKENVIHPLYEKTVPTLTKQWIFPDNFQLYYGKPNKEIANEIFRFICPEEKASEFADMDSLGVGARYYLLSDPPIFVGYYSDYDWVLFCSLFGTILDLPDTYPKYCIDLKQTLDEKAINIFNFCTGGVDYFENLNFEEKLNFIKKNHPLYPKQLNEYDSLDGARFISKLDNFLKNY